MAQISRPFQVALLALAAFVLVWFVALHRPGGESSGSSSPSTSAAVRSHSAKSHATAPHVTKSRAGVSHVAKSQATKSHAEASRVTASRVTKSHTTVSRTTLTHTAHTAGSGSRKTVSHTPVSRTTVSHTTVSHTQAHAGAGAASSKALTRAPRHTQTARHAASVPSAPATSKASETPAMEATVAAELGQGKVVLLLFWNPHSADDTAVHQQVLAAVHHLGRGVVLHSASAAQVNSFGTVTRDIQVYQTPTLLIVNHSHQVTTLTGYTDAFAIEQAVAEARG
ncbi:MAG TPA: hypothetical protein VNY52_10450 [Solirubrobacteraceae bacterium]|nr:hypothetical protein [Solirubrobacteraceae bacterium]